MSDDNRRFVRREVRSEDPSLSPGANRLLTEELREALGRDEVRVPADVPPRHRERHGRRPGVLAVIAANRMLVVIALGALLIVAVAVSLATGSWWALLAAVLVHAIGTFLVAGVVLRLTTEVEHMAPSTAARLEEEGVADPDHVLSDLMEEYGGAEHARGVPEVISSGDNAVDTSPDRDPARAGMEQRTAMTPAGSPVEPSRAKAAPALLPWAAVLGPAVVALVAAIVLGGVAWTAPAVIWPVGIGWLIMQGAMSRRSDGDAAATGRAPGDTAAGARRRTAPLVAVVLAALAIFTVVMGLVGGYL
jgi:hypothetical protein